MAEVTAVLLLMVMVAVPAVGMVASYGAGYWLFCGARKPLTAAICAVLGIAFVFLIFRMLAVFLLAAFVAGMAVGLVIRHGAGASAARAVDAAGDRPISHGLFIWGLPVPVALLVGVILLLNGYFPGVYVNF